MHEKTQPTIIELNMQKIAKANLWLTMILLVVFIVSNSIIHQRFSAFIFILGYSLFYCRVYCFNCFT